MKSGYSSRYFHNERLTFLTDGIFAIVMTLLVLELKVPKVANVASSQQVIHSLEEAIPEVISYVVSFIILALYWSAHNRIFRSIERYNTVFVWLNLVYLLFVAFVPFTTGLYERYGNNHAVVVSVYAAVLSLVGLSHWTIWFYASSHRQLIAENVTGAEIRHELRRALIVPVIFALSIPIAFVNLFAAQYFWVTVIAAFIVVHRMGPLRSDI